MNPAIEEHLATNCTSTAVRMVGENPAAAEGQGDPGGQLDQDPEQFKF